MEVYCLFMMRKKEKVITMTVTLILAIILICIDDDIHVGAVHQVFQDAKLLFGASRHQILPLLRQDGQVCNAPLDVLGIVDVGWSQFHQMTNAPAYQIAVALQITVFAVGRTEDFGLSHGSGRLFCYDQFCDKNPSNLFWIAICTAAKCRLKIRWVRYLPHRVPPARPRWESQSRPCPRCSLHRGQGLLFRPAFSASAL